MSQLCSVIPYYNGFSYILIFSHLSSSYQYHHQVIVTNTSQYFYEVLHIISNTKYMHAITYLLQIIPYLSLKSFHRYLYPHKPCVNWTSFYNIHCTCIILYIIHTFKIWYSTKIDSFNFFLFRPKTTSRFFSQDKLLKTRKIHKLEYN